jgi:hypothetical protein
VDFFNVQAIAAEIGIDYNKACALASRLGVDQMASFAGRYEWLRIRLDPNDVADMAYDYPRGCEWTADDRRRAAGIDRRIDNQIGEVRRTNPVQNKAPVDNESTP